MKPYSSRANVRSLAGGLGTPNGFTKTFTFAPNEVRGDAFLRLEKAAATQRTKKISLARTSIERNGG